MTRPSRHWVYVRMAELVALRGTCERAQVGAILVRGGRIIATGYNGAPSRLPHCTEIGCLIEDGHCVRTVHAEANVIAFAAKEGISTLNSTLYCTHEPCINCAKLLINSGVVSVYYQLEYSHTHLGLQILKDAGVEVYKEN